MSTTYSVRHTTLDTRHALVVPNLSHRGLIRSMVAGAKIQARLRHPGIVSATDVLEIDDVPALILDLVEGPSLEQFVPSHEFDERSIDAIAASLFDAVAFLHGNSVVHRHLKPHNIMVDLGGDVAIPRISDFTLAKVIGADDKSRRRKPRVFGTAAYMSPEQTYDSDAVGPASDLWSLGCVLYYLCTTKPAFSGPDSEHIFEAVRAGRYEPISHHVVTAPTRWMRAIEKALVVDEKDRIPDAAALAAQWFEGATERPQMSAKSAPVGRIALVFTDVQGSTRLWEANPEVARHSLRAHDAVIRASMHRHGGYEVKTEGDSFMVAFRSPIQAARFCLEVQHELHEHPWSPDLLGLLEASEAPGFRGLRVRMGIHVGRPEARVRGDQVDYFGPMVNRAARIASAGHGGQIVMSRQAWNLARATLRDEAVSTPLGSYRLRGLSGAQELVQLVPPDLAERQFAPLTAEPVEEGVTTDA